MSDSARVKAREAALSAINESLTQWGWEHGMAISDAAWDDLCRRMLAQRAAVWREAARECDEWVQATVVFKDKRAANEQRFAYMNAAAALRAKAEEETKS